jgi:MFS superfamily sulfate permease-like transporter
MALPGRLSDSHLLTVGISLLTLIILMAIKTYRSHWPAPLIAIVMTTLLVWATSAQQYGIATIGWKASSLVYPSLTGRGSSRSDA